MHTLLLTSLVILAGTTASLAQDRTLACVPHWVCDYRTNPPECELRCVDNFRELAASGQTVILRNVPEGQADSVLRQLGAQKK